MKSIYFCARLLFLFFVCSQFIVYHSTNASQTCLNFAPEWYISNPTSKVIYSYGTVGATDQHFTLQNRQQVNILQQVPFFTGCENHDGYLFSYTPTSIVLSNNTVIPLSSKDLSFIPGSGLSQVFSPYANTISSPSKLNEDLIIKSIAQTGKIVFRTDSFQNLYPPINIEVPATNCVKLSEGNAPNKIVFVVGESLSSKTPALVNALKINLQENFLATEPFEEYADRFSFYVDLKKVDDKNLATVPLYTSKGLKFYTPSVSSDIKNQSSCKGFDGISNNEAQYIYIFNNNSIYYAWSPLDNFIFLNAANGGADGDTMLHEFGHAFAGILDEYDSASSFSDFFAYITSSKAIALNCTTNPYTDFRDPITNTTYIVSGTIGCNGKNTFTDPSGKLQNYYRSASESIMRNQQKTKQFSTIHCGYIVAALKGERPVSDQILYKKNASKYWNDCKQMGGTVFEGGFIKQPPSVSGVNSTGNNTFSISGSGLTPENNAAKLTYAGLPSNTSIFGNLASVISSGYMNFLSSLENLLFDTNNIGALTLATVPAPTIGQTFDIPGLASTDGKTITFNTCPDVPPGKYKVSAGAFNSDWTDTNLTINVVACGSTVPPTTPPTNPPVEAPPTPVVPRNACKIDWLSSQQVLPGASLSFTISGVDWFQDLPFTGTVNPVGWGTVDAHPGSTKITKDAAFFTVVMPKTIDPGKYSLNFTLKQKQGGTAGTKTADCRSSYSNLWFKVPQATLTSAYKNANATSSLSFTVSTDAENISSIDVFYVKGTAKVADIKVGTVMSSSQDVVFDTKTVPNATYKFYAIVNTEDGALQTDPITVKVKN